MKIPVRTAVVFCFSLFVLDLRIVDANLDRAFRGSVAQELVATTSSDAVTPSHPLLSFESTTTSHNLATNDERERGTIPRIGRRRILKGESVKTTIPPPSAKSGKTKIPPSAKVPKTKGSKTTKSKKGTLAKAPSTAPITRSPTQNKPTAAPVQTVKVPISPYRLGYQIVLTYVPSVEEVNAVVNVTQTFLTERLKKVYSNLITVETVKVSDRLILTAPYEIVYNSTAIFPSGATIPTTQELDINVQTTFTGNSTVSYLALAFLGSRE